MATELEARLVETGKTHDVLEIGYSVDDVVPKKKKEYKKSYVIIKFLIYQHNYYSIIFY